MGLEGGNGTERLIGEIHADVRHLTTSMSDLTAQQIRMADTVGLLREKGPLKCLLNEENRKKIEDLEVRIAKPMKLVNGRPPPDPNEKPTLVKVLLGTLTHTKEGEWRLSGIGVVLLVVLLSGAINTIFGQWMRSRLASITRETVHEAKMVAEESRQETEQIQSKIHLMDARQRYYLGDVPKNELERLLKQE